MKFHVNPVYRKELKLGMRSIKMAIVIFAYNALLALIGLLSFYLTFESEGQGIVNYNDVLSVYVIMAVIQFGLVLFVVPALTAGSISGERERQTLEILLTTRLRPLQIVLGKLLSSISMVLLLTVSSVPVLSIMFAIGGVGLWDLLQLVFMILVTAVFIGSIGILFSAFFKRTVPSTVCTYGMVLFLTLGTFLIFGIAYLLAANAMYKSVGYTDPNMDYASFLLLVNPVFTIIEMMMKQYAGGSMASTIPNSGSGVLTFISDNWFAVSIAVQMLLSGGCIALAARLINPLKRKTRARKKASGSRGKRKSLSS